MEHPVVLFDGICNFCNGAVNFIIRRDHKDVFRFTALQSEAGQQLLENHQLPTGYFDSFILLEKGKIYKASGAALKVCSHLPWYWQWTQLFWIVPAFLRDAVYQFIARNRYKWFGKKESCMIPGPEVRKKFL